MKALIRCVYLEGEEDTTRIRDRNVSPDEIDEQRSVEHLFARFSVLVLFLLETASGYA